MLLLVLVVVVAVGGGVIVVIVVVEGSYPWSQTRNAYIECAQRKCAV